MCCNISAKRVISFAIAFALGLLIVSGFSSVFGTKEVKKARFVTVERVLDHGKSSCGYDRNLRAEEELIGDDIFMAVPPPAPPAPPIAPVGPEVPESIEK